jgi:outer membrane biosynthesis protein TonB
MILRKKLIEESGLTRDRAILVIRRLDAAQEITPVKDRHNYNRISYSEEDADKIKQALQKEEEEIAAARAGSGKTKKGKPTTVEPGSPPPPPAPTHTPEPLPTPEVKSVRELATTPGPKKREKPAAPKADEEEKPTSKLKELLGDNQQTLFLIAGGVGLLLFLLWLRGRSTTRGPSKPDPSQAAAQGARSARDLSDAELKALRAKYNAVFREL